MVRVINHLGGRFRHTIIALDKNFDAASQLGGHVHVRLLSPPRQTRGMVRSTLAAVIGLRRLRPNVLMTYNWGAIEWAIAHRLVPIARHVHLDAGFGKEEADRQLRRRVWCRRWALACCSQVVVPSRGLQTLARNVWKVPSRCIAYLPNGVDVERFAAPARDTIPRFTRRPGELVVGTVAPLRPEKNIARLLRVFALIDPRVRARLIIAGDGMERATLERLAEQLGIASRVIFLGQVEPESVLGTFDIFALSSDTEQMPNALLEAMAASRAVVAVDVGDVKDMVCGENRNFIVSRDNSHAFAAAIERLLGDEATRERLGRANQHRVIAKFSQDRMFSAYSEIFGPNRRGFGA
jgi:glycosyltransferase involved in cell wall biosynthesis